MTLTPRPGDEKLEILKFLPKVCGEDCRLPTWPFDWKLLLRFSSAQAVPLLTLIGAGQPITHRVSLLPNSSVES